MNRDDIFMMEPGRAFDLLIATLVIGRDDKCDNVCPPRGNIDDTIGRILPDGYHERTPYYTTRFHDALAVIEAMQNKGFGFLIGSNMDKSFNCRFWPFEGTVNSLHYQGFNGKTIPEAICKTALIIVNEG